MNVSSSLRARFFLSLALRGRSILMSLFSMTIRWHSEEISGSLVLARHKQLELVCTPGQGNYPSHDNSNVLDLFILPQLVSLYVPDVLPSRQKAISIRYIAVQQQAGYDDCGPFAIHLCFAAAKQIVLRTVVFDQSIMRKHLLRCYEEGKFLAPEYRRVRASRALPEPRIREIVLQCQCIVKRTRKQSFSLCKHCAKAFCPNCFCSAFCPSCKTRHS